jgi:hypothetical protein
MSEERDKKYGIIFILTAIFAIACPVAVFYIFSGDIINAFFELWSDDDAIYWVIGTIVLIPLFGLLATYMVYNKVKKNVTTRSKRLALIFLPLLVFGTGFGLYYIIGSIVPEDRGPYLSWMNDPTTTMTVSFERKTSGDYTLFYGSSQSTMTTEIPFTRLAMRTEDGYYHYIVNITGLNPNTRYYYNIPDFATGPIPFKTAPNSQTASYKFLLYGDSREDNKLFDNQHGALINQLRAKIDITELAFAINTGDIAREHDRPGLWNIHFDDMRELAKSVPFFVASGNHEWNTGDNWDFNDQPALKIQDFPIGNNPSANVYTLDEVSYSFGYANAFFIFLGYPHAGSNNTEYMNWLEQQLAIGNSSYDFTFVSLHRPPFDDRQGTDSDDNLKIIKNECPLFHNYSVEAVFSGHNHLISHMNISWASDPNGRDITYIISGGGGASLREPELGPWNNKYGYGFSGDVIYAKSAYNYYIVEVNGAAKTATFTAYELGGDVLESFTIGAFN